MKLQLTKIIIGLSLLLLNVIAMANTFTCPNAKDFIKVNGLIYGWSWGLPKNSQTYTSDLINNIGFASPNDPVFSPDYPLKVTYYISSQTEVYCSYRAGFVMATYYFKSPLSKTSEMTAPWTLSSNQRTAVCETTAGRPEVCSINY